MSEVVQSIQSVANSVMLRLGCHRVVSEGMMEGELFCAEHGSANDVAYGWSEERGCQLIFDIVLSARIGDVKKLAERLEYLSS